MGLINSNGIFMSQSIYTLDTRMSILLPVQFAFDYKQIHVAEAYHVLELRPTYASQSPFQIPSSFAKPGDCLVAAGLGNIIELWQKQEYDKHMSETDFSNLPIDLRVRRAAPL